LRKILGIRQGDLLDIRQLASLLAVQHERPRNLAVVLARLGMLDANRIQVLLDSYEAERHPHLAREVALIRRAIQEEVPVLGVCLGSQLLGTALGSQVRPARKELGWFPVALTPEGIADPLFVGVSGGFTAFHWHGDAFDPPPGSVSLASSELTPCQAFRHGPHVGLLFHMEMGEDMIRALVEQDLASGYADYATAGRALDEMPRHLPSMRTIARKVFGRVSDAIAGKPLRA
jgi:GMP synthase (glutamine-hydrolysing)